MSYDIEHMRERIHEQAEDWMTLTAEDGTEYEIPVRAFQCYVMTRTAGRHLMPDWDPVARPGMKLQMDNRYHTDCVIAAGFGPDDWRGSFIPDDDDAYGQFTDALNDAKFDAQQELLGFESAVLHDAGYVSGVAIWPEVNHEDTYEDAKARILVLENGSPENAKYLTDKVQGIVFETGGELCHLAQVGREDGITVMRDPNARERVLPAVDVSLKPRVGTVELGTIKNGYKTVRDGRRIPSGRRLLEEGEA